MNLVEMRAAIRIELSDAAVVFSDGEIDRSVTKSVSLLSRFIPKRAVVETVLYRDIDGETLTIATSTGTLAYKPIKSGSVAMTGKTEDIDFEINYLTGVVTEIGALLADTDYTVSYELDDRLLDISTLLPEENYIKIDRMEYPAGESPPTLATYEIYGEFLLIKSSEALRDDAHLRIQYLKPWTTPTASIASSLTTALTGANNDIVFTARTGGVVGNGITIKYTDPGTTHTLSVAVSGTDIVITLGYATGAIISTAAGIKTLIDNDADTVVLVSVANATGNVGTGVVTAMTETALTGGSDTGVDGDYPEHLDTPIIIGSCGQALIFKAEKYVQQSVTELELVNAAADAMAVPLGDINVALDRIIGIVGDKATAGDASDALDKVALYLETNDTVDCAKDVLANITDDAADLRTAIATALDKSSTYLTSASTPPSAHDYLVYGDDYITKINDAERVAEKHAEYARTSIQIYQSLVAEATVRLENIKSYIAEATGWTKMGDAFMVEAGQRLKQSAAFISEATQRISEVNAWAVQADRYTVTSREYLNIAGRYLASGQAKINEFLVSIGVRSEYYSYKGSSEQFS